MKMYDVIIEQHNGRYRALIPMLPKVEAEGETRDEAILNVKQAAELYLSRVEIITIEVDDRQA